MNIFSKFSKALIFTFLFTVLFGFQASAAKKITKDMIFFVKENNVEYEVFTPDRKAITMVYTGKPLEPKIEIIDNGKILKENIDYKLEYHDTTSSSEGYIYVNGLGEYDWAGCNVYYDISNVHHLDALQPDGSYVVFDINYRGNWSGYTLSAEEYAKRVTNCAEYNIMIRGGRLDLNVSEDYYTAPHKIGDGCSVLKESANYLIGKTPTQNGCVVLKPETTGASTGTSGATGVTGTTSSKPGNTTNTTAIKNNTVVKLSKTVYTYTGKQRKPKVSVLYNGKTVPAKSYSVKWVNNTKPGTASVVVTGKGTYAGKINTTKTFVINPKKVSAKTPAVGKGTFTAKWKKAASITGYQVQISSTKNFAKNTTKTVTTTKTSYKLSGLQPKKSYYCRVRAFKRNSKGTYYGAWSAVKNKKTK